MDRTVRKHRPSVDASRPAARAVERANGTPASVLALQRAAGNRAVAQALGPVVQRTELAVKGGGLVADYDGPGTNQRRDVLGVQERLLALWSITTGDFDIERAAVAAKGDSEPVLAADIKRTLAAIDRNAGPHLGAASGLGVFKAALLDGVGQGQANNAADIELILNLLHEEWHVSNDDYDRGIVVLTGSGTTVDPAAVPGFLAGLTKLKQGYVGGYPFRGTTAMRKRPIAPDGPDQAAYEKAIAHNLAERAIMEAWIAEAKGQRKDVMLRNSAEWCTSGATILFTLTPTHDSPVRAEASGHKGEMAVFSYPGGPLGQPPIPYVRKRKGAPDYDNTDVVSFQAQGVGGFNTGNHITVIEPSRLGKQTFFTTLKHESQHHADRHESQYPADTSSDAGQLKVHTEMFKSEVRAYWLAGQFNHLSPTKKVKRLGYTWNERQYGIFSHLMAAPVAAYPYMRKNWNDNVPGWRDMVIGFNRPESINPVNSVRIEHLRQAIEACTTIDCLADDKLVDAHQPRNPKAAAVSAAIAALDATDRAAIGPNMALNSLALTNLAGRTREHYFAIR
jgi:hypothetical protein